MLAIRQRIGILDVRQMRDTAIRMRFGRPQKKIVMQEAVPIGLLVRVED